MSTYTLFHLRFESPFGRDIRFEPDKETVRLALKAGDYEIAGVFDVQSDDASDEVKLDEVFDASQNIHESWVTSGQNLKAVPIWARNNPRSTSVGDVIIDPNAQRWIVLNMGFGKL